MHGSIQGAAAPVTFASSPPVVQQPASQKGAMGAHAVQDVSRQMAGAVPAAASHPSEQAPAGAPALPARGAQVLAIEDDVDDDLEGDFEAGDADAGQPIGQDVDLAEDPPARALPAHTAMSIARSKELGREAKVVAAVKLGRELGELIEVNVGHSKKLLEKEYSRCLANFRSNSSPLQGHKLTQAFRAAVEEGKANARRDPEMLRERAENASELSMEPFKPTPYDTWHGTHGSALASSRLMESPSQFKMKWSVRDHAFFGSGRHDEKVARTLQHIADRQKAIGRDGEDMRPLMHAGVELAQRNSGHHIRPDQGFALIQTLIRQAGDPDRNPLSADQLRMVVAGLVAVWNPQTSAEVVLKLMQSAENQPDGVRHEQLKAVAEGFGIGMGWKGMSLINHHVEQHYKGNIPEGARKLFEQVGAGQATGKKWLIRLEASLHGMQGKGATDMSARLEAVDLLRKYYMPSGKKSETAGGEKPGQTPGRVVHSPHLKRPGEGEADGEETSETSETSQTTGTDGTFARAPLSVEPPETWETSDEVSGEEGVPHPKADPKKGAASAKGPGVTVDPDSEYVFEPVGENEDPDTITLQAGDTDDEDPLDVAQALGFAAIFATAREDDIPPEETAV